MTGGVGGLAMVNGTGASVELEEVIIEDLEVGPYAVYALYLVVSMFFELFGFAISYFLSQSHAARCGAISGLGVTIALQSIRVDDLIAGSSFFKSNPSIKPIITFVLAFSGYVIFLFGIFSYHRRRIEAREMLALHTQPITTPQS